MLTMMNAILNSLPNLYFSAILLIFNLFEICTTAQFEQATQAWALTLDTPWQLQSTPRTATPLTHPLPTLAGTQRAVTLLVPGTHLHHATPWDLLSMTSYPAPKMTGEAMAKKFVYIFVWTSGDVCEICWTWNFGNHYDGG